MESEKEKGKKNSKLLLWFALAALIFIVLLVMLTDWSGFVEGFNRGFEAVE